MGRTESQSGGLGGLGQGRGCERLGIGFEGRKFLRTASRASAISNVKNDKKEIIMNKMKKLTKQGQVKASLD